MCSLLHGCLRRHGERSDPEPWDELGIALRHGPGTLSALERSLADQQRESVMGRGLLLWLIGIPLPIILVVWLLGGLN